MKTKIAFAWLLIFIICHQGCIHDQIIKNKKLIPINDTSTSRLLQKLQYGPIRIHLIYNTTDIDPSTTLGSSVLKIMNIITLYWQKTLEVYYVPALSFNVAGNTDKRYVTCLTFNVPEDVVVNPVPNKDFGLLIQAKNDGATGTTAYSYPCAYSMTTNQPLWGFLHWNLNYFKFDLQSFQMNVKIGIHECTHIFGFSNILYPNYIYGKQITTSKGSFINGSYIQKAVRQQYGCVNNTGMLLEQGGGSGTSMSHWSYKVAFNQYMTAGVMLSNPTISYLTQALLEQTGWYKTVHKNYGQFLNFGYQKGCKILDNNDCSSDQYCKTQGEKACDYDQTSLGYCRNETINNCLLVKFYFNYLCVDPNFAASSLNGNLTNVTGEAGGQYSRCFQSNLILNGAENTKYAFRCYKTLCSSTGKTLTIQVGNKYVLCLFPRQQVTVSGYSGYITCPKSFSKTCAQKRCPKQCDGNGICLNGKCLCSSSYTGDSCSQVTSIGFSSKQTIFMASNNHNCLAGSYLSIFGQCQACSQNCINCNQNGCRLCINGAMPNNDGSCK